MHDSPHASSTRPTPIVVWERLLTGNARFVAGQPEHRPQPPSGDRSAAGRTDDQTHQDPYTTGGAPWP